MAGLLGAGRTEVLRAIFGADPIESGTITLRRPTPWRTPTPRRMKALGLGYTPENRKEVGLVQIASVHDNLLLASLRKYRVRGFTTREREAPAVSRPDPRSRHQGCRSDAAGFVAVGREPAKGGDRQLAQHAARK